MEEQNWEKVTNSGKRVCENCGIAQWWYLELVNCIDTSVDHLLPHLKIVNWNEWELLNMAILREKWKP